MNLSFDIAGTIQVVYERRGVVLETPGKRQRIPTIPPLAALLEEHMSQTGYTDVTLDSAPKRKGLTAKRRKPLH